MIIEPKPIQIAFGLRIVANLVWRGKEFPVYTMDKVVFHVPEDGIPRFECPEFYIWRKRGSLTCYFMVRKQVNKRLITSLYNISQLKTV